MWRRIFALALMASVFSLVSCVNNNAELEDRILALEKRLDEQKQKIREVSGQHMPPRDFGSDIQRISDQQDRINEILRTKVDPINDRLEEFREWAREAQNEQTRNAQLISELSDQIKDRVKAENALNMATKTLINDIKKLAIQVGANKKSLEKNSRIAVNMAKEIRKVREVNEKAQENLLTAVKKTLMKLKNTTYADLNKKIAPIEQRVHDLSEKALSETTNIKSVSARTKKESEEKINSLLAKIRELENIIASQKASLLEVGSRVHELETRLRASSGA